MHGKRVVQSEEGVYEMIKEGVLQWFNHVERMERDRIPKRVCRRVCWYSFSGKETGEMDRYRKRVFEKRGKFLFLLLKLCYASTSTVVHFMA